MDRLSAELRAAEREIDGAYRSNGLTRLSFAPAAWNLLGIIEDQLFLPLISEDETLTRFRLEALIDHFMFIIRLPIYWLKISCAPGGQVPENYSVENYEASSDFLRLASEYNTFYKLFTYASRGLIDLRIESDNLIPIGNIANDSQYEAYNRLVKPVNVGYTDDVLFAQQEEIRSRILPTLKPEGERFSFEINPSLVAFTIDALEPILKQKFVLPGEWKFFDYSISDFRKVFAATTALAFLQYSARFLAVQLGCPDRGFAGSLMIARKYELLSRLIRYTGLKREIVKSILYDLTLGSNDIPPHQADPTQQPFIPLNENSYAIMPQLWINNAAERNFVALLNRVPTKKRQYLSLVGLKEDIMRQRLEKGIAERQWRTWSGTVRASRELPDIDLAVIDDDEKTCLLLELKWFIDPAEPRELVEKSEEVSKGISQLLKLKRAFVAGSEGIFSSLNINSDYTLALAVVSENWIGLGSVQHAEVPVIREYHLLKKIAITESLQATIDWLQGRKYLPVQRVHYEMVWTPSSVGNWKTKWYGIKPLIEETEFLPL